MFKEAYKGKKTHIKDITEGIENDKMWDTLTCQWDEKPYQAPARLFYGVQFHARKIARTVTIP